MTGSSWKPWEERQGDEATGSPRRWPVPASEDDEDGDESFWQAMAYLTSIGWILALPVAAGVLAGAWLDRRLGTAPALTLSLLGVGVAVAAVEAYLVVAQTRAAGSPNGGERPHEGGKRP